MKFKIFVVKLLAMHCSCYELEISREKNFRDLENFQH